MSEKTETPLPQPVLVGFYAVDGFGPDMVEVPLTGDGPKDYAALNVAIRARHPKAKSATRTGSAIETRDPNEDPGYIDLDGGMTLRQLFDPTDTNQDPRSSRVIGRVFFSGTPCNVVLTFNRAAGSVGLLLLPRVKIGSTAITFSNVIQPQRPVLDLDRIVREVLGNDAHALELRLRPAAPAPVQVRKAVSK